MTSTSNVFPQHQFSVFKQMLTFYSFCKTAHAQTINSSLSKDILENSCRSILILGLRDYFVPQIKLEISPISFPPVEAGQAHCFGHKLPLDTVSAWALLTRKAVWILPPCARSFSNSNPFHTGPCSNQLFFFHHKGEMFPTLFFLSIFN